MLHRNDNRKLWLCLVFKLCLKPSGMGQVQWARRKAYWLGIPSFRGAENLAHLDNLSVKVDDFPVHILGIRHCRCMSLLFHGWYTFYTWELEFSIETLIRYVQNIPRRKPFHCSKGLTASPATNCMCWAWSVFLPVFAAMYTTKRG